MAFAAVTIKHRNVIIKEGVTLETGAAQEKSAASSASALSPKVLRTDLEVGKSLAPPVSV